MATNKNNGKNAPQDPSKEQISEQIIEKEKQLDTGDMDAGILSLPLDQFLSQKLSSLGNSEEDFERFTRSIQAQKESRLQELSEQKSGSRRRRQSQKTAQEAKENRAAEKARTKAKAKAEKEAAAAVFIEENAAPVEAAEAAAEEAPAPVEPGIEEKIVPVETAAEAAAEEAPAPVEPVAEETPAPVETAGPDKAAAVTKAAPPVIIEETPAPAEAAEAAAEEAPDQSLDLAVDKALDGVKQGLAALEHSAEKAGSAAALPFVKLGQKAKGLWQAVDNKTEIWFSVLAEKCRPAGAALDKGWKGLCKALRPAGNAMSKAAAAAGGVITPAVEKMAGGCRKAKLAVREKLDPHIEKLQDRVGCTKDALLHSHNHFIASLSDSIDLLLHHRKLFWLRVKYRWEIIKEWMESNKLKTAAICLGILACIGGLNLLDEHTTAYNYYYNGKLQGVVSDAEDVRTVVDLIGDDLGYLYGANVILDMEKDITFEKIRGFGIDTDSQEQILTNLTYLQDTRIEAYGIYLDGKRLVLLDSEETANTVLKTIQNKYLQNTGTNVSKYEDISFAGNVKIFCVDAKLAELASKDEALDILLTGGVKQQVYKVVSGDTFSGICKKLGVSQADLKSYNPDINPDRLSIDQELVVNGRSALLTVKTTEIATYKESIPFDVDYEETANLYKGESSVKRSGTNGQREVTARIVKENGAEVSREVISQTIISEPVNQITLTGTKELPPLIGTGTYVLPVRGYTLTSKFGSRWGRTHTGIDMAAPKGTKVYATDGGNVISAGWESGKGYTIRIDHGRGITSVYAHLSAMYVKKGTKVYQGQNIGAVGSTGNSTGPHLHFEILVNGSYKNPLNYI